MAYGLNDNTVRRIAALAHHSKGPVLDNISSIYTSLTHPETINKIANAHTLEAMQNRFSDKESENTFKLHLAKAAAINRGTLHVVSATQIPTGEGLEPKN